MHTTNARHVLKYDSIREETEAIPKRYIGSFKVLEYIDKVAYRAILLLNMSMIYNVIHVSMLCKYVYKKTHHLARRLILSC